MKPSTIFRSSISHRDALFGPDTAVQEQFSYKWVYSDEFIYLQSNPNLVIGVQGNEVSVTITPLLVMFFSYQ